MDPRSAPPPSLPQSHAFQCCSVVTTDTYAHALAQQGWALQYEQLSSGPFAGRIDMLRLPGINIVHERTNQAIRQCGEVGSNALVLAIPILPSKGTVHFSGLTLTQPRMMVGPSDALDISSPRDFALLGITIDAELLQQLWTKTSQEEFGRWVGTQRSLDIPLTTLTRLIDFHNNVFALQDTAPDTALRADRPTLERLRDDIVLHWLDVLPNTLHAHEALSHAHKRRVVQKAIEAMLDSDAENMPSILDVCQSIGASPRKLTYCFQDILGLSPQRYHRLARLNRVHWALCQSSGDDTIQDIAARWGFWHMGQFARSYRQLFNQSPSETRQAARQSTQGYSLQPFAVF